MITWEFLLAWPKCYKLRRYSQQQICERAKIDYEVHSRMSDGDNPWLTILKRKSWLLAVELEEIETSKQFVLATCHAPLLHKIPHASYLLTDILFTILEKFAGDQPTIILGDFNITPDSEAYHHIVHTPRPTKCLQSKQTTYFYQPQMKKGYSSFIKHHSGSEPKFTCRTAMNGDTVFEGTLDYIFTTNLKIVSSQVGTLSDEPNLYPTQDNPSDHLPLHIDLEF